MKVPDQLFADMTFNKRLLRAKNSKIHAAAAAYAMASSSTVSSPDSIHRSAGPGRSSPPALPVCGS